LEKYGYGKKTLLATSLCCDELARPLENDFAAVYGRPFCMGGLAGFPFGGLTGFGAMAHHIPDGGDCLVVYGPHVGVDSTGKVGTVERRGRQSGGACCGSAAAACGYVLGVHEGETASRKDIPLDPLDYEQTYVDNVLLPYAGRLSAAKDLSVELPLALFEAQKSLILSIISKGASAVAGTGRIAMLGGVQINTPTGMSDYFLPLQFDMYDNNGKHVETLLWKDDE
jgi:hypothetical protein